MIRVFFFFSGPSETWFVHVAFSLLSSIMSTRGRWMICKCIVLLILCRDRASRDTIVLNSVVFIRVLSIVYAWLVIATGPFWGQVYSNSFDAQNFDRPVSSTPGPQPPIQIPWQRWSIATSRASLYALCHERSSSRRLVNHS